MQELLKEYHYLGLDVHKKVIVCCVKKADGTIDEDEKVNAAGSSLNEFVEKLRIPGSGQTLKIAIPPLFVLRSRVDPDSNFGKSRKAISLLMDVRSRNDS